MRIANLKKAVWGLMAFASTLVCVMDCYPLIPAVYGVYCLSSGHTIIFYIGLIIGMGYFISIPSICKYLFIIAVIYFGERLFVRKSSKNGCLTTAVVAACATAVMNLSVTFLGRCGWITSFLRKSSREFFTVELSIDNSIFLVAMRFWETPVLIPNTMVKT